MKTRTLQIILLVLLSVFTGYYLGISKVAFAWKNYAPSITITNKEPPFVVASQADFSLFWTVWQKLQTSYYDKKAIDGKTLVNGAISGMVQSLNDPYTVYLPPTQNKDFKQGMAGKFEGIGAELITKDKQIVVVSPLSSSPAERAGIRAGDIILKVDSKLTIGWTLAQAVEKIRGPKGTTVVLAVLHKDAEKPVDISVVRDTINVKSVIGWIKIVKDISNIKISQNQDSKIAYIKLSQFGDQTNTEWVNVVNAITSGMTPAANVKGVIVDLRNNPGGYLTDATFIASEFIPRGTVVIQEAGSGEKTEFSVSRRGLLTTQKIIVLINKGSASASEIVAGALRDHGRAKLIGETSFGKGTIQSAEDLGNNNAGLHITIAKWLTPNGTWVHDKGLEPDIRVVIDDKNKDYDNQLEKAVLELLK